METCSVASVLPDTDVSIPLFQLIFLVELVGDGGGSRRSA